MLNYLMIAEQYNPYSGQAVKFQIRDSDTGLVSNIWAFHDGDTTGLFFDNPLDRTSDAYAWLHSGDFDYEDAAVFNGCVFPSENLFDEEAAEYYMLHEWPLLNIAIQMYDINTLKRRVITSGILVGNFTN